MKNNSIVEEKDLIKKALASIEENASNKNETTFDDEASIMYSRNAQDGTQNSSGSKNEYTSLLIDSKVSTLEIKLIGKINEVQSDLSSKYSDLVGKISENKPSYWPIVLATIIGLVISIVGLMIVIFPVYNENYWLNHKQSYIEEIIKAVKTALKIQ